jgi:nucleoid DNA-binding protein
MDQKILTKDLVYTLTKVKGMTEEASETFVKELFKLVEEALIEKETLEIEGLGVFSLLTSSETEENEEKLSINFEPAVFFSENVNKPFAHLEPQVLAGLKDLSNEPSSAIYEQVKQQEKKIIKNDLESLKDEDLASKQLDLNRLEDVSNEDEIKGNETKEEVIVVEKDKSQSSLNLLSTKRETSTLKKTEPNQSNEPYMSFGGKDRKNASDLKRRPLNHFEKTVSTHFDEINKQEIKGGNRFLIFIGLLLILVAFSSVAIALISIFEPDFLKASKDELNVQKESVSLDSIIKEDEQTSAANSNPILDEYDVKLVNGKYVVVNKDTASKKYYAKGYIDSTYVVKKNENLLTISRHFYGKSELWTFILKANRDLLKEPDHIPVGLVIRIPNLFQKEEK